jgi:glycosyltransferase involved in cell wall biosynthesis
MEVSHYFQSASIVVLPYIDASQSGVIPVAYAFKKPVIVTNVGSLTELVDDGKTGIIIPPKNTEKLAETIIKMLLDERNLQKMGENAYQKIVKDGSWDLIAKKTLDAYASIHKKKFYED